MADFYLKASSEAELFEVLTDAGITQSSQETDDYFVTDGHKYALDVIGSIRKATGETFTDEDSGIVVEITEPVDGFHANLRVYAEDFDETAILEIMIDAPNNPVRGWA